MTNNTSKYIAGTVIVLLAMILGPVACTIDKNEKITQMVKSGTDPRIAKCGVDHIPDTNCAFLQPAK